MATWMDAYRPLQNHGHGARLPIAAAALAAENLIVDGDGTGTEIFLHLVMSMVLEGQRRCR